MVRAMARLCHWQCPQLTLRRSRFLYVLCTDWVVHTVLLGVSLLLVADATGESVAVWGYVADFAPALRATWGPRLLALLGVLAALAAGCGMGHAGAVRDYKASLLRRRLLCAQVVLSLELVVLGVAAGVAASLLANKARNVLEAGMSSAMRSYNLSGADKVKLDRVQYKLQCCGARSYREWFEITWFNVALNDSQPGTGNSVSDDVPYSCCKRDVLFPCIHHGVLSANPVYRYDPEQNISISTEGCAPVLGRRIQSSVRRVTNILWAFTLLQLAGAVLTRLVQTAVQSAQDVRALSEMHAELRGRARRRALDRVVVHSWLLGCKPSQPPPLLLPPAADSDADADDDSSDSLPELGDSAATDEDGWDFEEPDDEDETAPILT